jgi:hypothetical protein
MTDGRVLLPCVEVAPALSLAITRRRTRLHTAEDFVNLHNAVREAVGVGQVSWDDNVAVFT